MTDAVWIALIAGIVTTIGSIITAVVSIRNGRKTDELDKKTDVIKEHTNGTLSKLTEQLKDANETIAAQGRTTNEAIVGMHKTIERIAPTER